jgi:hypothetical protein
MESAQCLCLSFDKTLFTFSPEFKERLVLCAIITIYQQSSKFKFEFNGPNTILEFIYIYI